MKIYIAAPLFNDAEKARNIELRNMFRGYSVDTYLPQADGGIAFDMLKNDADIKRVRKEVFENDLKEIKKCDIMFCVLDGRVPDEGVCIELGIAYALGKKCIGYKTDQRSLDVYGDNLMIEECLETVLRGRSELEIYIEKLNGA